MVHTAAGALIAWMSLVVALKAADPSPVAEPSADVFYQALHGEPEPVEAGHLLAAPGRYVGRAVRTRGRLERPDPGQAVFELRVAGGRLLLRLEPQAAAATITQAEAWRGKPVEVEGFFYRDLEESPEASYVLRAWLVRSAAAPRGASAANAHARLLTLQDLVYGAGRHDGTLVRVRGTYRGSNVYRDLPEPSRKGARDWVLKDGHFAVWVTGREALASGGRETTDSPEETGAGLEVVGTPSTAMGVVRVAARAVGISAAAPAPAVGRTLTGSTAGWEAVAPRLSFSYPVPGQPLGRRGQVILQFNKPMDPSRFDTAVSVRYERDGVAVASPRVAFDYRDRFRAVVITPDTPPPPHTVLVVELREGIIDVDGRALTPLEGPLRFGRGR
jgi:hypothetical protein